MFPLPRTMVLVSTMGLAVTLTSGAVAGATTPTLPPTIQTIVNGDVTSYQWMLDAVNAPQAWTASTGAGVVVADIDTGLDATHPDFANQVVPGAIVVPDTKGKPLLIPATIDQTSNDWYGHGSHVAGIIAANADGSGMTGIAPDAKVMPIDLETGVIRSQIQFFHMVEDGINYARDNGADVINMSLGGESSGFADTPRTHAYIEQLHRVCNAVDAATEAGTVVVASAGNSGDWGNPQNVPASCATTVTVGAIAPSFDKTYWSSYDASVDLAAPGQDVLSVASTPAHLSPTPHILESGTSMAAPVVSGVAALLRSAHPGWDALQIADRLRNTAQDLGPPGRDPDTGYGLVDAAAALNVATLQANPSDFFVTWAQQIYGGAKGDAIVSWTTPQGHAVNSFTVTVHTQEGTTDYAVDGQSVRTQVVLNKGDGWTVTAHTTAGDVTTYPGLYRFSTSGGARPEKLRHVKLERHGDAVVISWDPPVDPTTIDRIGVYVGIERRAHVRGTLKIDQSATFPTHLRVELPAYAKGYDVNLDSIDLMNTDDNGNYIGGRWQRINKVSRAPYGSRIGAVLSAGRHAADVVGQISPENAKRVCGKGSCAGQKAVLLVAHGDHVLRIPVRYSIKNEFHALVAVPDGAKKLRLRIEGPQRLDSGPFHRYSIQS